MRKLIYIIIILLLILQWNCNNTSNKEEKIDFFRVEWNSKIKPHDYFDATKGYYYGESVLVKNPPQNIGYAVGDMMIKYREQYGIDFSNMDIDQYIIVFYKYDSESEVYLTQEYRNDWNGVTYRLLDDYKYKIGMLVLERCDSINNKWTQYLYIDSYDEKKESPSSLRYSIDSCVSVIDNQFQGNGQPITYTPMN